MFALVRDNSTEVPVAVVVIDHPHQPNIEAKIDLLNKVSDHLDQGRTWYDTEDIIMSPESDHEEVAVALGVPVLSASITWKRKDNGTYGYVATVTQP